MAVLPFFKSGMGEKFVFFHFSKDLNFGTKNFRTSPDFGQLHFRPNFCPKAKVEKCMKQFRRKLDCLEEMIAWKKEVNRGQEE